MARTNVYTSEKKKKKPGMSTELALIYNFITLQSNSTARAYYIGVEQMALAQTKRRTCIKSTTTTEQQTRRRQRTRAVAQEEGKNLSRTHLTREKKLKNDTVCPRSPVASGFLPPRFTIPGCQQPVHRARELHPAHCSADSEDRACMRPPGSRRAPGSEERR